MVIVDEDSIKLSICIVDNCYRWETNKFKEITSEKNKTIKVHIVISL